VHPGPTVMHDLQPYRDDRVSSKTVRDEDWNDIEDIMLRRRVQNRVAQRYYGPQTKPLRKPRARKDKNHIDLELNEGSPAHVHVVLENGFRGKINPDTIIMALTRLYSYRMSNCPPTELC